MTKTLRAMCPELPRLALLVTPALAIFLTPAPPVLIDGQPVLDGSHVARRDGQLVAQRAGDLAVGSGGYVARDAVALDSEQRAWVCQEAPVCQSPSRAGGWLYVVREQDGYRVCAYAAYTWVPRTTPLARPVWEPVLGWQDRYGK